jgi:hypothetical protein
MMFPRDCLNPDTRTFASPNELADVITRRCDVAFRDGIDLQAQFRAWGNVAGDTSGRVD